MKAVTQQLGGSGGGKGLDAGGVAIEQVAKVCHLLAAPAGLHHEGAIGILNKGRPGQTRCGQLKRVNGLLCLSGSHRHAQAHQFHHAIHWRRITKQARVSFTIRFLQSGGIAHLDLNRGVLPAQTQFGHHMRHCAAVRMNRGSRFVGKFRDPLVHHWLGVIQAEEHLFFREGLRHGLVQPDSAQDTCVAGHDNGADSKLGGDGTGVLRPRATKGQKSVVLGGIALCHADLANRIRHVFHSEGEQCLKQLFG